MLEIAHLCSPMPGQTKNGDAVYIRMDRSKRSALICMIDGLGHGPAAAQVAEQALGHLSRESAESSVDEMVRRLDHELRGGRGAAATVCVLGDNVFSACGVGNVSLRSRGTNVPFVLSPGVLGIRVHRIHPMSVKLKNGDRIVLHTDGVGSTFSLDAIARLDAKAACQSLFDTHRKKSDDATVLVLDVGEWQ